jgi:hypothetical protein
MTKIVLVETISMFRHIYAVELEDNEPNEYALDDVTCHATGGRDYMMEEIGQQHVSEDIFSHRQVSEEEYIQIFDQMNPYSTGWDREKKLSWIYKGD